MIQESFAIKVYLTTPPEGLNKGQVLRLDDGVDYFFAGYDKGYSGNSALFCLHDPRNDRFSRPSTRHSRRRQSLRSSSDLHALRALREELDQAQKVTNHALAAPNYHHLTPDEIRSWMGVIQNAFDRMIALKPKVLRLRHVDPNVKTLFLSVVEQIKQLSYQKQDFEWFWYEMLCDPAGGKGKRFAEQLKDLQLLEASWEKPAAEPIDTSELPF